MLLASDIRSLKLIADPEKTSFRATSYDLRAGKIVKPNAEVVHEYKVPPQGIVEVISKEIVTLPGDVCGFVAIKTSTSTRGLLALNIGIIDPMYSGPISSFLVNFSQKEVLIQEGDVFLRTHFVRLPSTPIEAQEVKITEVDYVKAKKGVMSDFGDTFLNVDDILSKLARSYAYKAVGLVGALALVVTFANFLANVGTVSLLRSWVDPKTSLEKDIVGELRTDLEKSRADTQTLRNEITSLRACLDASRTAANSSTKAGFSRC